MEMAILREMHEGKEIAEISWVPTNTKIADSMTKKGVPSFKILGSCLSWKNSLFNNATLSYFLFAELMPYRNEKKKGEELLSHASDLAWYSLEKNRFG